MRALWDGSEVIVSWVDLDAIAGDIELTFRWLHSEFVQGRFAFVNYAK